MYALGTLHHIHITADGIVLMFLIATHGIQCPWCFTKNLVDDSIYAKLWIRVMAVQWFYYNKIYGKRKMIFTI